jgi:uncharacterized protein YndB with AHSA1/START domain
MTGGQNNGRKTSIVVTATIAAPQDVVWRVVSDATRNPQWVEGALRVPQAETPLRLGATYEELSRIAGPWKATTQWRITEFDAPQRQVQEGTGVPTANDMRLIMELSPEGEGTHFILTLQYTPKFGLFGAVLDSVVKRSATHSQQRSADALAALIAKEYADSRAT